MSRSRVTVTLLGHEIFQGVGTLVKNHGFVSAVGIQANGSRSKHLPVVVIRLNSFTNVLGWRRGSIGQEVRHGELHIHLKLVGRRKHVATIDRRKGIALTRIAIVVGVVTNNFVPSTIQRHGVELGQGWRRGAGFLPKLVSPAREDGNLDALVVFNGALEQIVEILVSVAGKAASDAGIVPQTLGRTS